jgi:ATP-dependent Lhr-like helicase
MGRVPVQGEAQERLLAQETARLMEASGLNKIVMAPVQ